MNVNDLYSDVVEAVVTQQPEKYFRKMYHILTTDHEEKNYNKWLEYLVDIYSQYRGKNRDLYTPFESTVHTIIQGIDELQKPSDLEKLLEDD